jgi:4-hydroxy-2-oxoheptanedioate aldolase
MQDLGAMGIMFPDISTAAEVERLHGWMLYPPHGSRGHTSGGPAMDHRSGSGAQMRQSVDDQMLTVIQIESRDGVDSVDAILDAGGVDIVEIGRGDLSVSLGVPFETRHPQVLDALDKVVASCGRHNVAAGTNCASIEDAQDMMARGIRCVSYSTDRRILANAYDTAARELRAISAGRQARPQ